MPESIPINVSPSIGRAEAQRRIDEVLKIEGTELDLSGLRLTTVPEVVWKLRRLRLLRLQNNQLITLPEEIAGLTELNVLRLEGNKIEYLPDALGKLKMLEWLLLQNNRLKSLPESLRQLSGLSHLFLHDNPDLLLPDEVLGTPWSRVSGVLPGRAASEILDYYYRVRGNAGRALGECKLIVVGRGGAGKTSLIKRLSGISYDRDEPETHGITIQSLKFSCKQGAVKARVWDFGGQVVLHSMHEFFLTARSLYLLVMGERDDMLERDAAYWFQLIRSYAGNAPVVVAMNKSAGRQRTFDRATLEQHYGPILGWVSTECSDEDAERGGIASLRRQLTAALDSSHMDSVRRKFPRKWFAIKDVLEDMKESYLDYEQFVKLCNKYEEHEPSEQTALAADLHDLGVALNYRRDARLRDTTVLRPDWLANGIYAVLRSNDLDSKNLPASLNTALAPDGIVTTDILKKIHIKAEAWKMLRASDYPQERRDFLLRLMDLFHLSYPLDEAERKHLVPTLLPLHPPDGADEPKATGRLRLRYEFQVVPAPLLPWFIARTFSLIPDRKHWRRGAILVLGRARARVWTTQDERYVFVTVAGVKHDRQRLLAVIRGTLSSLFADYKGLRTVEQWEHKHKWVPRETLVEFGVLPKEGPSSSSVE